ncbi:MAG TPA: hypothetical protein VIF34_10710 [Methylocystis sp.]|jgi:hypothetical protein
MVPNAQAEKIICGVLQERLKNNGYSGSDILFDEDFDGEKIIRVIAHLEKPVSTVDELFDSVDAIRQQLLENHDDRFVFLAQDYPGANEPDVGEEDDGSGAL